MVPHHQSWLLVHKMFFPFIINDKHNPLGVTKEASVCVSTTLHLCKSWILWLCSQSDIFLVCLLMTYMYCTVCWRTNICWYCGTHLRWFCSSPSSSILYCKVTNKRYTYIVVHFWSEQLNINSSKLDWNAGGQGKGGKTKEKKNMKWLNKACPHKGHLFY